MKLFKNILFMILLILLPCVPSYAINADDGFRVMFEENYDYADYKMNGKQSKTAVFVNKNGSSVWSLRQNTPTMFINVEQSDRSGFGDVLKISTAEENGNVFFGNSGSDWLLPEVKEDTVVLECEFMLGENTLPTYDSYVMWQIMTDLNSEYIIPFVIRKNGDKLQFFRSINKDAVSVYQTDFHSGKWIKIRVVFDYTAKKWYAEYISPDKTSTCFIKDASIPEMFIRSGVRSVRTTYDVSGNMKGQEASLFTDNFRYYALENVTGFDKISERVREYSSLVNFNYYLDAFLENAVVMNIYSARALAYGEKKLLDKDNMQLMPVKNNDIVMVPVKAFLKLFRIEAEENDGKVSFEINGNRYEISAENRIYRKNSAEELLKYKSIYINNTTAAPIEDLASFLGKKISLYDDGLIIIAQNSSELFGLEVAAVKNKLIYDDPAREDFLSDFRLNEETAHPRVLVSDSDYFKRIKESIKSDVAIKEKYAVLLENADKILRESHLNYNISDTQRQIQELRKFRQRAQLLGMAYHIENEEKYAQYLYAETKIAAAVSTDWRTKGYLNAGTLLMGLGVAYDSLYEYLDAEQRNQLRTEIIQRHIMPGLEAHRGTLVSPSSSWTDTMNTVGWVSWASNWNIICNSGMMVMASAMIEDEPDLSSEIMERCYKSLKYYIPAFYPDGAALESLGYLSTILSDFARVLSTMQNVYNTTYGITEAPGISQMPYVIEYLTGPVAINNFGDAAESAVVQPAETLIFAGLLKDSSLADLRNHKIESGIATLEVTDLLWHSEGSGQDAVTIEKDKYFRVGETGSIRSSWENDALFLSYHAGDNTINHSHMDTGAFVLDALGERWAIDLGSDSLSYNMNPESGITSRWDLYYLRSEGHNTLTINPDEKPGQNTEAFSPVIRFESNKKGSLSIVDMSQAYKESATKAYRGYMLNNDRSVITVRDEVKLKTASDVYWFMHTRADIKISANGKEACLTQNGKKMYIKLFSKQNVKFSVMDAVPFETSPKLNYQASTEGIKKLTVYAPSADEFNISVSFATSEEMLNSIDEITELDDWSVLNSYTMDYSSFEDATELRSLNGGFLCENEDWYTYAKGNFSVLTRKEAGNKVKEAALEIKAEGATSNDAFWMWENENFAGKTNKIIQIEQRYFIPSGGAFTKNSDTWLRHDNRFGEKMEAVWYAYILKDGKIMHNNGNDIYSDIPFDEWFTLRVVYYIEEGCYDLVLINENVGREALVLSKKITNTTMLNAMRNGGYKKSRTQLFMNGSMNLYFGSFSVKSLNEYIETVWNENLPEASIIFADYKGRFVDSYKLFFVHYSGSNLKLIKSEEVGVNEKDFTVHMFDAELPDAEKGDVLKLFLWDGETISPATESNIIIIK